jgi:hypothetical protein
MNGIDKLTAGSIHKYLFYEREAGNREIVVDYLVQFWLTTR